MEAEPIVLKTAPIMPYKSGSVLYGKGKYLLYVISCDSGPRSCTVIVGQMSKWWMIAIVQVFYWRLKHRS